METRKPYPTDLSDGQWAILEPFVPAAKAGGHPETYAKREIVNAILYVVRSGGMYRHSKRPFVPRAAVRYAVDLGRRAACRVPGRSRWAQGAGPLVHDRTMPSFTYFISTKSPGFQVPSKLPACGQVREIVTEEGQRIDQGDSAARPDQ